jgi:hypothetical protein
MEEMNEVLQGEEARSEVRLGPLGNGLGRLP